MQTLKAASAVFCTACICAELLTQLTGEEHGKRGIKAIAGLYILAVAIQAIPNLRAEWADITLPSASSVSLGTWDEMVIHQTEEQLAQTLEAQCREAAGVTPSITLSLTEAESQVSVSAVTVHLPESCTVEQKQAVERYFQQALGVTPEFETANGETLK